MIISQDTNPEREVYYLGALVLQTLKQAPESSFDFFDVFQELNVQKKVSINLFTLTLDWLFLLDVISIDNGKIIKCF